MMTVLDFRYKNYGINKIFGNLQKFCVLKSCINVCFSKPFNQFLLRVLQNNINDFLNF